MAITMQVYIELALLENFCMDYVLLYSAKALSKNPAPSHRIALGAAAGAGVAVVFPLLPVSGAVSAALKALSGAAICFIGGKFVNFKKYLKFAGIFFALSLLLGGGIIAVFNLGGFQYFEGAGYLISSVPIGIPLFLALLLFIGAKNLAKILSSCRKERVKCRVVLGQSKIELAGFFDSGNKVYLGGAPVSVIPKDAAQKLEARINKWVKIHTVAGSARMGVFLADRLEIENDKGKTVYKNAYIGVNPAGGDVAVIHADLMEGKC